MEIRFYRGFGDIQDTCVEYVIAAELKSLRSEQMWISYLSDILALTFRALHLPLISQHRVNRIGEQYQQAQIPHKSDSIKEVGVTRTSIDPEMVENGT